MDGVAILHPPACYICHTISPKQQLLIGVALNSSLNSAPYSSSLVNTTALQCEVLTDREGCRPPREEMVDLCTAAFPVTGFGTNKIPLQGIQGLETRTLDNVCG